MKGFNAPGRQAGTAQRLNGRIARRFETRRFGSVKSCKKRGFTVSQNSRSMCSHIHIALCRSCNDVGIALFFEFQCQALVT